MSKKPVHLLSARLWWRMKLLKSYARGMKHDQQNVRQACIQLGGIVTTKSNRILNRLLSKSATL